jgi:hypothetical protein
MNFFRTYGFLWSREREDDVKEFIKFAEPLLDALRSDHAVDTGHREPETKQKTIGRAHEELALPNSAEIGKLSNAVIRRMSVGFF